MKIILDFDDVIFNTRKFIKDYKKVFAAFGVPEKEFDYPRERDARGRVKTYDLKKHLKSTKKRLKVDVKKLEDNIADFIKQGGKYVFDDAFRFLEKFSGQQLYILSYGNKEWQARKIENSGVGRCFEKIIIVNSEKSNGIGMLFKSPNECIMFVDDRVEHIEDVKRSHPQTITVLLQRKEGRYKDRINKYCDFRINNFKELEKLVENLNNKNTIRKGVEICAG